MITKVEIFSPQPDAPILPLGGFMPSEDAVQIRDIQGLGPVKADLATTPFATGRGELYQGGTTGKRNIVLTLGLNPDWVEQSMSSLRQLLYRYFLPEAWTKLRFTSDYLPQVEIEGYVESFEPNMFSQDPEVQISIICPRPDFVDVSATIIYGTVDDGTIETEFEYLGTVETGYELRVVASEANAAYTGDISITSTAWGEEQLLVMEAITIDITQYFRLSSVRNAKRVSNVNVSDGVLTNLLSKMTNESVWPVIKTGQNLIKVAAAEDDQTWTLTYFNKFGGL